jgi:hypothetical protein
LRTVLDFLHKSALPEGACSWHLAEPTPLARMVRFSGCCCDCSSFVASGKEFLFERVGSRLVP